MDSTSATLSAPTSSPVSAAPATSAPAPTPTPAERPQPMAEANLNASITNDVPALLMDWRIITGQTGAKMGMTDADTATEATFVERASNLRDAELQKAVLRWLKTAGKKMWQLVRATLTLQLFVKLRGMDDNAVKMYPICFQRSKRVSSIALAKKLSNP